MDEIKVRNNTLGLKIYINGLPKMKLIPKNVLDVLLVEIERSFNNKKRKKIIT